LSPVPAARRLKRKTDALGSFWESLHDSVSFLGFTGEHVSGNLALFAFGLQNSQHLHELAEEEDLLPFGQERLQQLE